MTSAHFGAAAQETGTRSVGVASIRPRRGTSHASCEVWLVREPSRAWARVIWASANGALGVVVLAAVTVVVVDTGDAVAGLLLVRLGGGGLGRPFELVEAHREGADGVGDGVRVVSQRVPV